MTLFHSSVWDCNSRMRQEAQWRQRSWCLLTQQVNIRVWNWSSVHYVALTHSDVLNTYYTSVPRHLKISVWLKWDANRFMNVSHLPWLLQLSWRNRKCNIPTNKSSFMLIYVFQILSESQYMIGTLNTSTHHVPSHWRGGSLEFVNFDLMADNMTR